MRERALPWWRGSGQGKRRWSPRLFWLVRGSHYRSGAGVDLGEIGGISTAFGVEGNRRAGEEFNNIIIFLIFLLFSFDTTGIFLSLVSLSSSTQLFFLHGFSEMAKIYGPLISRVKKRVKARDIDARTQESPFQFAHLLWINIRVCLYFEQTW